MKRTLSEWNDILIPANDSLKLFEANHWAEYNTFTIVRHPIARIQSLQAMLVKLYNLHFSIHEILDLVENDHIMYYRFDNTQEYVKRHALPLTHPHYNVYKDGKINVDKWWKLEELATVKPQIEAYLGRKLSIPKANSTTDQKPELTEDEIIRIKKIYQRDIEVFYS